MIVTEMFVISYDLSWFSSLKNLHILLLVQIIVHIDDVIKIADVIKNTFLLDFLGCFLYCWIIWCFLETMIIYIVISNFSFNMSSNNTRRTK